MKIQWWPSECKALLKGIKHQNLYKARAHVDPLPLGLHVETWYGGPIYPCWICWVSGGLDIQPPLQNMFGLRNFHKKLLPRLAEKIHVYKTEVWLKGLLKGPAGEVFIDLAFQNRPAENLNCRIFLRRWANFANLCLVQTYSNKVADQQLENMMPPFWTEKPKETKNFSPRRPQSSSEPARFCGLSVDPGIFCKGLWQIQDVLRSGRTSIELQQEIVWHSGTLVSLHHPLRFGNSELSEPEGTSRGQPKFLHVPTHHSWIPMTPVDPATMSTLRYSTMRKTINRQRWAKGPWAKAVA